MLPSSSIAESTYAASTTHSDEHPSILLPPPSNEEIDGYFSLINSLKYSQPHQPLPSPFSPPLDGLTITAYCAGHTLGGTIWSIQYGSESVVYAVDWNQARENVLAGAAWLGEGASTTGAEVMEQLRKPTALVCSSKGSNSTALVGGWKTRDETLLEHIRRTIDQGGNVLIPCDTSARALELAYLLERAWSASSNNTSLQRARLFFASSTNQATMRYVRSMLEWMDDSIIREFEAANNQTGRNGGDQDSKARSGQPFEFKYLKSIERQSQLQRAMASDGSKIFLASDQSLEWGFSKDILEQFAADPRNLVVLTSRNSALKDIAHTQSPSLSDVLWSLLEPADGSKSAVDVVRCDGKEVTLVKYTTSALGGNDLALYQQYMAGQRQRQSTTQGDKSLGLETSADAVDEGASDSSSSSDESDGEHQGKALNVSAALTHSKHKLGLTDEELGVNILLRRKDVHDYDVRGKKGRDKVFPFIAKRKRDDDFGDIVRPEDYLRAEERDDVNGLDMNADLPTADANFGQKRKFDNKDARRIPNGRNQMTNNKRRRTGRGEDRDQNELPADAARKADESEEQSEESDYEPAEPVIRGPTKIDFKYEKLRLNLSVTSVDYSGIHDKRTLQMLIPLIRPRKLILTGGSKEETSVLAVDCRKMLEASSAAQSASEVFTPEMGVTVDASVDTNAWTIKLSQSLYRHLKWQNFRGLGIVTVNGRLQIGSETDTMPDDETTAKKQKMLGDNEVIKQERPMNGDAGGKSLPTLDVLPPQFASSTRSVTQALHVGDLRLAELRKLMQSTGHTAEFKGEGTLLVDGMLAVRKTGLGKIVVESGWSAPTTGGANFFSVKKKIYEGLAVVAGR